MAKLILSTVAKNEMATQFADFAAGGQPQFKQTICLFRTNITDTADFNQLNAIDLDHTDNTWSANNLTINGPQNFKALSLYNDGGKVKLSSIHNVSTINDIGNYENPGSLVWAIPASRNVDWIVIGSHFADGGYLRAHAAIELSSKIQPSSEAKTFLISNLSIEFKGDGE